MENSIRQFLYIIRVSNIEIYMTELLTYSSVIFICISNSKLTARQIQLNYIW